MWPFNGKKSSVESDGIFDVVRKPMQQIVDRDLNDINKYEAQLRLWLPEKAKQGLVELSERTGDTMTSYLTKFFVAYLYGYHELEKMRETGTGLYFLPPDRMRYSRMGAQDVIPELGKNLYALKVDVPGKLKEDLQKVADSANVPVGRFVREVIVSHLFGHTFWQARLRSWTEEEEAHADAWESGNA